MESNSMEIDRLLAEGAKLLTIFDRFILFSGTALFLLPHQAFSSLAYSELLQPSGPPAVSTAIPNVKAM